MLITERKAARKFAADSTCSMVVAVTPSSSNLGPLNSDFRNVSERHTCRSSSLEKSIIDANDPFYFYVLLHTFTPLGRILVYGSFGCFPVEHVSRLLNEERIGPTEFDRSDAAHQSAKNQSSIRLHSVLGQIIGANPTSTMSTVSRCGFVFFVFRVICLLFVVLFFV